MQPVLSLIKDSAGRALHHLGADLLATVSRQTVQNDGSFGGLIHQSLIDAEASESLFPLCLLMEAMDRFGFLRRNEESSL